jgi:hypothetical protein
MALAPFVALCCFFWLHGIAVFSVDDSLRLAFRPLRCRVLPGTAHNKGSAPCLRKSTVSELSLSLHRLVKRQARATDRPSRPHQTVQLQYSVLCITYVLCMQERGCGGPICQLGPAPVPHLV